MNEKPDGKIKFIYMISGKFITCSYIPFNIHEYIELWAYFFSSIFFVEPEKQD